MKKENIAQLDIFMLMPFKEDLTLIYEKHIKGPLESKGHSVKRADDFYQPNVILEDILKSIRKADIIIADLTGRNPNVFYELGRAHEMQNKYVIQIIQKDEQIPFDVSPIRSIKYENSASGYKELEEKVLKFVENFPKAEFERIEKSIETSIDSNISKLIEDIKTKPIEKLGDLIITIPIDHLLLVIQIILKELYYVSTKEQFLKKEKLYEFVAHSLLFRIDENDKIEIFDLLFNNVNIINKTYKGEIILAYFKDYSEIKCIKFHIIHNNLLDFMIDLFGKSKSFKEADILAQTLLNFINEFDKRQILKLCDYSLENNQIYGANKASKIMEKIFETYRRLIPEYILYKLADYYSI